MENGIKEINIDNIVRSRAGKRAKYVPKWLTSLLARIIHQEFINIYLRQGRVGVDFCRGVVDYVGVTVNVEGRENLPTDGRLCTFVSNHPLGAIDGVTLGWVIGEHYQGKIKYLVNDLLMNLQGLAPLCVPINKIGKQARSFPTIVENTFSSDCHVIMFPAGLCSRRQDDGTIRDVTWNKAFVAKNATINSIIVNTSHIPKHMNTFAAVLFFLSLAIAADKHAPPAFIAPPKAPPHKSIKSMIYKIQNTHIHFGSLVGTNGSFVLQSTPSCVSTGAVYGFT